MSNKIEMQTTKMIKNPNTKTTFLTEFKETVLIDFETYDSITNKDTLKWFRRLGGSETVTKGYTWKGYQITKLVSTSPDRDIKMIRKFTFVY
jgi:hypothetical protein